MICYSTLKYEQGELKNGTVNVGDMIQSLAAIQYLPRIDYYVERGQGKNISDKFPKSFCIMNGWYSKNMLPMPTNITPFYISIHCSKREMLTPDVIAHLKQHSPIGCRDISTLKLLQSQEIDAYYSGCLTLTFPRSKAKRSDRVYLVDLDRRALALIPENIKKKAIRVNYNTPLKVTDILKSKSGVFRPLPRREDRIQELLYIPKVFLNSEFRCLFPSKWTNQELANLLHFFKARSLLNLYSQASLVITNRVHCASPCIALGTPVIFIPKQEHLSGQSRFEFLEPYIPINMKAVSTEDINWHPQAVNIENHKHFLRNLCQKAVEMCKNPLQEIPLTHFHEESGWNSQHFLE
jgi:hypothetical protein